MMIALPRLAPPTFSMATLVVCVNSSMLARVPGPARDALLMRVIGSPDPYGKHTDGMGGATSSTSKCVIIAKSSKPDHDVDYLYGQVSIDTAFVDWSGNCGNLSTAVGPFAIANGFIDASRIPREGTVAVRVWQANIGKTIIVHVPIKDGQVQETGDFELDGVTFPAAEIVLEFLDPSDDGEEGGAMFPTGNLVDGGIEAQARQAFANLRAVCAAAGGGLEDVVRVGLYLTDLGDFAAVNAVMAEVFAAPYPARSTIEVSALPKGAAFEVDAILVLRQAG